MKSGNSRFFHLHLHTTYSERDGLTDVDRLADFLAENGFAGAAITDHGTMAGVLHFHDALKARGLKPILGMEAYMFLEGEGRDYHITLLAKNIEGYRNLAQLTKIGARKFRYKPRFSFQDLAEHSSGLIVLSGCMAGLLSRFALEGDAESLFKWGRKFKEVFGDDFYLEIMDHSLYEERVIAEKLLELSSHLEVKVVPTNDSHYLKREDEGAHKVLYMIGKKMELKTSSVKGARDIGFRGTDYHVLSWDEMVEKFGEELVSNTLEVAEKVEDFVEEELYGKVHLPPYNDAPVEERIELFKRFCEEGLRDRYGDNPDEKVLERLRKEQEIIIKKGFADYFLIVSDFVKEAKRRGIWVGPGRGSAAGSLVAYILHITDIDPLKHGLFFERFLNEERNDLPDIDVDFAHDQRDEVRKYIYDKYGHDRVALIGTFGTFKPKAVADDVLRVYKNAITGEFTFAHVKDFYVDGPAVRRLEREASEVERDLETRLATLKGGEKEALLSEVEKLGSEPPKRFPFLLPLHRWKIYERSVKEGRLYEHLPEVFPEIERAMREDPVFREQMEVASKLEGGIRNLSVHAAGLVIAPFDLTRVVPLMRVKGEEMLATQYEKNTVERVGLVKMDLLGLKNLTYIKDTLKLIKENRGEEVSLSDVPLDDPDTFALFQSGETVGVFQMESDGMRRLLRRIKPTSLDHIIAANALYRPGPIQSGMMDSYCRRKNGEEEVTYLHPAVEEYLRETFGVVAYQEQVMMIAHKLAGFSLAEADLLRRAMAKKKHDVMEKMREKFVEGCVANGLARDEAERIFDDISKFASYGFNKSHSTVYGYLAYYTAYLKAHYPQEFMVSIITGKIGLKTEKLLFYLNELKRMGIRILSPSVNRSSVGFSTEGNDIRYGLAGIKDVGESVARKIVEERERNGEFRSLEDFFARVDETVLNSRALKNLAAVGGFDELFPNRALLVEKIDEILRRVKKQRRSPGEASLFGDDDVEEVNLGIEFREPTREEVEFGLKEERKILGFYLSEHISSYYKRKANSEFVRDIADLQHLGDGELVWLIGEVRDVNVYQSRFKTISFHLEDDTGEVFCRVSEENYAKILNVYDAVLQEGRVFNVLGRTVVRERLDVGEEEGFERKTEVFVEVLGASPDFSEGTLWKFERSLSKGRRVLVEKETVSAALVVRYSQLLLNDFVRELKRSLKEGTVEVWLGVVYKDRTYYYKLNENVDLASLEKFAKLYGYEVKVKKRRVVV